MLTPDDITSFYNNVLHDEESYHEVSERYIRIAIQNLAEAYMPYNTNWSQQASSNVANYNDPAHRCAYLHKYAPLHTCLVQDMFHRALTECSDLKCILLSKFEGLNICSLGGGPGTDIIGIISACQEFGLIACSAHVVDLMPGWKSTFNSIVKELRIGSYGNLSMNLNANYFHSSYVSSNLLHPLNSEVLQTIRSADVITMVKFISAATCRDTEGMVKNIFNNMKPGAVVLFIDNAAGGFSERISQTALECELDIIFGPMNHFLYTKPAFIVKRYGSTSCFQTKVTVQVWMKSSQSIYLHTQGLNDPSQHLLPNNETTSINITTFSEISDVSAQLTEHMDTFKNKKIIVIFTFLIILLVVLVVILLILLYTFFFR